MYLLLLICELFHIMIIKNFMTPSISWLLVYHSVCLYVCLLVFLWLILQVTFGAFIIYRHPAVGKCIWSEFPYVKLSADIQNVDLVTLTLQCWKTWVKVFFYFYFLIDTSWYTCLWSCTEELADSRSSLNCWRVSTSHCNWQTLIKLIWKKEVYDYV